MPRKRKPKTDKFVSMILKHPVQDGVIWEFGDARSGKRFFDGFTKTGTYRK